MLNIKKTFLLGFQIVSVLTLLSTPTFAYSADSSDRASERAEEADLYDRNRLQLDFNPYDYDDNDRRDNRGQRQPNTNNQYYQQNSQNYNTPQDNSNYYYPNNNR